MTGGRAVEVMQHKDVAKKDGLGHIIRISFVCVMKSLTGEIGPSAANVYLFWFYVCFWVFLCFCCLCVCLVVVVCPPYLAFPSFFAPRCSLVFLFHYKIEAAATLQPLVTQFADCVSTSRRHRFTALVWTGGPPSPPSTTPQACDLLLILAASVLLRRRKRKMSLVFCLCVLLFWKTTVLHCKSFL